MYYLQLKIYFSPCFSHITYFLFVGMYYSMIFTLNILVQYLSPYYLCSKLQLSIVGICKFSNQLFRHGEIFGVSFLQGNKISYIYKINQLIYIVILFRYIFVLVYFFFNFFLSAFVTYYGTEQYRVNFLYDYHNDENLNPNL